MIMIVAHLLKILSVICFLSAQADANDDRGPFLSRKNTVKIQTWIFYGQTEYSSINNETMGNALFNSSSPGNRLEIEFFPEDDDLKKKFEYRIRYLADCEWVSFGTLGSENLNQLKFGLAASWWVFGNNQRFKVDSGSWAAVRKSEFNLYAGPSVSRYTELASSINTNQVTGVTHPLMIGMQTGFRTCIPVSDMGCIDVSGRAVFPVYLTNLLINSLKYFNSVSFYGSIIYDYAFHNNFSLGAGVLGSLSRLNYMNKSGFEVKTSVLVIAPTLSVQVRF